MDKNTTKISRENFIEDFYRMTYKEMALKYGVSLGTIANIRRELKLRKRIPKIKII